MTRSLIVAAMLGLASSAGAQQPPGAHLIPENARPLLPGTAQPPPVELAPARVPTACEAACLESRSACAHPCDAALTAAEGSEAAVTAHLVCIDPCVQTWGSCVARCAD